MESKPTNQQTINRPVFQLETLIAIGLAAFLLLLPFHLVIKRLVPGPVGTYWKEILLGILVILWLLRCLVARRFLFSGTPIDWAVLIYLAFLVVRLILDRSGWIAAWGFYISVLYLPVFWLVPTALHLHFPGTAPPGEKPERQQKPDFIRWVTWMLVVLVAAGTLLAVGGILEFILDISLWPSEEVLQRQGFSDVYIYGTQIRRVYFTLDSPTAMANTLAMLLPLALVLPFILKRTWTKILAGIAAALIAACIILTFSRGIWVAVVLGLIFMAVLSAVLKKNWKSVLIFTGSVLLIGVVWVTVTLARSDEPVPDYQGLLELSSSEYLGLPLDAIHQSLLLVEPQEGNPENQAWSLYDPLTGQEDVRQVLYEHPPESGRAELIYRFEVPTSSALRYAIAMPPQVWSPEMGDGVSFQIFISAAQSSGKGEFVFVRYINPKLNPSDRRWRNYLVDLSPWAGEVIDMTLITESGPNEDWSFDWAGWSDLQIVTIDPAYLESARQENSVLRHTGSILDWVRDETNRDRLAAWNTSLEAWRTAPFWGNGLGTTGVAAFRTQPETAVVTESQFLKSLVELGIPGFLLFGYLWFQIATTGFLAFQKTESSITQVILLGVITSLLIVFIDGLVYQNLEVKQVNAYFWTIVGMLAVLSRLANQEARVR